MENTNTANKPKLEEAGALWKRVSKSGTTYLNGTVKTKDGQEIKLLIFSNSNKTDGSNQPDYRVYFDNPIGSNAGSETPKATKSNKSDEIPF
jgi:uncharacterized protein (DUF736 family)